MTKPAFDPSADALEVFGTDGSRFLQNGVFYGAPPAYSVIEAQPEPEAEIDGEPVVADEDGSTEGEVGALDTGALAEAMAVDPALVEEAAAVASNVLGIAPVPLAVAPLASKALTMDMDALEELTVEELTELAEPLGIPTRKVRKADLVAAILAEQAKVAAQ